MEGWIKLHRKILENPIICKDSDYLSVWMYLLLNATHKEMPALFKGEKIILKPGQLITGRKSIANKLKISESKIYRIINEYKSEHQIEQQTSNKNSLITILNWNRYQQYEQQNETQMNNKRTATEQQVNTNKNDKNVINNNLFNFNNNTENDFVGFEEGDEVSQYLKTKGINTIDEFKKLDLTKQNDLIEEWFLENR